MSSEIRESISQTQLSEIIKGLQSKVDSLIKINDGQKRTNQRTEALKQQFKQQRNLADVKS